MNTPYPQDWDVELCNRSILVLHDLIHVDRAGETGRRRIHVGNIESVDRNWVTAVTEDAFFLQVPKKWMFPASKKRYQVTDAADPVCTDFIAGLRITRTYLGVPTVPRTTVWLSKPQLETMLSSGLR